MLTIVLGDGRKDLRQTLIEKVAADQAANPNLTSYVVVPNHIKFDAEVGFLQRYGVFQGVGEGKIYAQSRVQVYSLTRLAWALQRQTTQAAQQQLSNAGLYMVVADILKQHAQELTIFSRLQAKSGFIDKLAKQLVELRASQVSAQDLLALLATMTDDTTTQVTLRRKLHDLAVVAAALNDVLGDEIVTSAESLTAFGSFLADAALGDVAFYFEGFNGFTAAERQIVDLLIAKYDVTLTLTGDDKFHGQQQAGDLFEKPLRLADDLRQQAQRQNRPVVVQSATADRKLSASQATLLDAWAQLATVGEATGKTPATRLVAAENIASELAFVGRDIRSRLQADPRLKLRDILVVARDLNAYEPLIETTFRELALPVFVDVDQTMQTHPLVGFVLSLLQPKRYFQANHVLSLLKTGLLRPMNGEQVIDEREFFDVLAFLDNYVVAYRPFARDWTDDADFNWFDVAVDETDEAFLADAQINRRINVLRRFVASALTQLQADFDKATTMRAGATALVTWLTKYRINDVLLSWRDVQAQKGELTLARRPEEVWQMLMATLDEVVTLYGERDFDANLMRDVLQAGFAGAKFSGIPNQLDQLTLSEMGIVQSQRYKHVYVIGGTRQNLPAQVKQKSLLNDAERDWLQPALDGKYLQDTAKQQMAGESLVFYSALATASDTTTFTYPRLNTAGEIQEPSPYFVRLQAALKLNTLVVPASAPDAARLLREFVSTPQATVHEWAKYLLHHENTVGARVLANLLAQTNAETISFLREAPKYANQVAKIKPELISALFGEQLNVSISQLESFYTNPYAYFLQYGLRLRERQLYDLNAAQTGTIYHAVLENVMRDIIAQGLDLATLSDQNLTALLGEKLTEMLALPEFAILQHTAKMRALTQDVKARLWQVLTAARTLQRVGKNRVVAVEQLFGFTQKGSLPPLEFDLANAHHMRVRGKIDRIDTNGDRATIIDYKSRGKEFKLVDAYHGLEMQLLTYWQTVQNAQQDVGGAFFAGIAPEKRALNTLKEQANELVLTPQTNEQHFKWRGLMLADADYLQSLEQVVDGQSAQHFAYKLKNNGELAVSGDGLAADKLAILLAHNETLMRTAGEQIFAGDFPLTPTPTSLTYSPYTDVMRFDRSLGDDYQHLLPATQVQKALFETEET
ncbi:MAG TPA: PD-(D/E)XK nuclease family protein [Lactobacillaceae bacterium]